MNYTRRDFICRGLCMAILAAAARPRPAAADLVRRQPGDTIPPVEARWYDKQDAKRIECGLCPKKCRVDDLERGYCGVRENRDGTYYTHVYAAPCAVHVDPIEKKPLFHFLPGTSAFSIATAGCNMDCAFCQNWEISQVRPEQVDAWYLPPEAVAEAAVRSEAASTAFTYTEPVVFSEYVYDTAVACRERGVRSVMISNGYIQEKPLRELCGVLDAIKVDLKSYSEDYYKNTCAAELAPVLESLQIIKQEGLWLEIVYLMVPTLNDSPREIEQLCGWVLDKLGDQVPVHFTRFYPMYRLKNLPSTPVQRLEDAYNIATGAGMKFVYLGNLPGHQGESTHCPSCGATVVKRVGYTVLEKSIGDGKCNTCGSAVPGVWQ